MTVRHEQTRAAIVAALVLVLDGGFKLALRQELGLCEAARTSSCDHIAFSSWLRLVPIENAGSVLGFAQGLDLWTMLAVASLLLITVYSRRLDWSRWVTSVAAGLQIGGAAGNLVDRLVLGGVVDYLAFDAVPIVFNLADVALLCGALLAMLEIDRARRQPFTGADRTSVPDPMPAGDVVRRAGRRG